MNDRPDEKIESIEKLDVITAIKPTQRAPGRLSIFVNKKFIGALPEKRINELQLTIGMDWTTDLAQQVEYAIATDQALRQAIRWISRRMYSQGELVEKLKIKKHETPAIDDALVKLDQMNLLDDEAFGRQLVEYMKNSKPIGRRLLWSKLIQKKLDRPLIEKLLDEWEQGVDEVELAKQLATKRLATSSMQKADKQTRRRRLWGLLQRRGFASDTIAQVLSDLPVDEASDVDW